MTMHRACPCCRRSALAVIAAGFTAFAARVAAAPAKHRPFIEAAFKAKGEAVRAGDQAYGAVVVKDGRIIGYGPSRVISKQDWNAHAEREAILDAQARLGRADLSGCLLYSSSRPCAACEAAAAKANIARMYHGSEATDAGAPRGRGGA
jgi:tRNA(Arg) A34 adenosine deaminase TadA